MAYVKEGISQLDTVELEEILKEEQRSAIVLDVRELEEYVDHHIPGLPLVPMSEIVDLIDQFDKEKEYIFVCRSGRRSHEVAKFFKMNGIENVHNYAGGMLDWKDDIATGDEWIVKNVQDIYKERGEIRNEYD